MLYTGMQSIQHILERVYDKSTESSYLIYWVAKTVHGWAMLQKFSVDGFGWTAYKSNFYEDFTKNYDENSDSGYIREVDIDYPLELQKIRSNAWFLPERMRIKKCKKMYIICMTKKKYDIHIKVFNQALHHGQILEKVQL